MRRILKKSSYATSEVVNVGDSTSNKDEAIKNINKLKKDLFNFRFQKSNGQLTSPSKIKESKRSIARLKSLIERKYNA